MVRTPKGIIVSGALALAALALSGVLTFAQETAPSEPVPQEKKAEVPVPTVEPLPLLNDKTFPEHPALNRPSGFDGSPLAFLYKLGVRWFGRRRMDGWVQKGMDSLNKNIYRKWYIEKGYFLLDVPDPNNPHPPRIKDMDVLPKDPRNDSRVRTMKDIHRLEEGAAGMNDSIQGALHGGDPDLIQLGGKSMLGSRVVKDREEWTYELGGRDFGEKPYYYNIRQRNLSKLKGEAGIGKALQIGETPYFVGGSLGVEGNLGFYRKENAFQENLQPKAKLGGWGKFPGLPGTSFGVSAIQSYRSRGAVFSTEFRAGLFHGHGDSSLGIVGYKTWSGEEFLSKDGRGMGVQAFYAPSQAVAFYLNAEKGESVHTKGESKFLAGVEFLEKRGISLIRLARELVGEGEDTSPLFNLAQAGVDYVTSPAMHGRAPEPEGLLDALRAKALEGIPPVGELAPRQILEAARSIERWRFKASGNDGPIPGWALTEVPAKTPEQVAQEILGETPPEPVLSQFERCVLIFASAMRREADAETTQAAMLLSAAVEIVSQNPSSRPTADSPEADKLWRHIAHLSPAQRGGLKKPLAKAATWLRQDFRIEGEKLQAGLKEHGRAMLKTASSSPDWPSGVKVSVEEDAWAPLLAGYGEDFFSILEPLREKAGKPLKVTFGYNSLPTGSRLRKVSDSEFYVELDRPSPKTDRKDTLDKLAQTLRSILPAD